MNFHRSKRQRPSFRPFALACRLFVGLALSLGCGGPRVAPEHARLQSGIADFSHGTWVYRLNDRIGSDPDAQDLGGFATRHGISEVYLNVSLTALGNPGLPRFVAGLAGQGLRVEALMGEQSWSDPQQRYRMFDRIDQVIAYNNDPARAEPEKFVAIHLDIENWVGSGQDLSWLPPLIDTYVEAGARIQGTGMYLAADINGSKVRLAEQSQRQAVLDAAGRLVLMQYELTFAQVERRTNEFLVGLTPGTAGIVIAIRVQDFACTVFESELAQLDQDFATEPSYLGWAMFDYLRYVAACGP